jgi:phosphate transport system substrate-binding protein
MGRPAAARDGMVMRRVSPKATRQLREAAAAAAMTLCFGLLADCRPSAPAVAAAHTVLGVGGSFPAPLYTRWAVAYRPLSGVTVNYQGIGSGAGIKQILAKAVDFGASDEPLSPAALDSAGLYQFPTVVGGVTPVLNVGSVGPGQLKLTGPLLADIYAGAVVRWNDPRIVALNPGLKLPDAPIVVVHRSDGSGTTFLFTSYLSRISAAWKAKVGANDTVVWPTGTGGDGNGGVAASVQQTAGAIGYVEYAYARQAGLAWVQLQNRSGAFVQPTASAFAAAAAGADWARSAANNVLLLDEPGAASWPITGATFILIYKQPPKPAKTRQVLAFFDWAYDHGDAAAAGLDYVPLPPAVKALVRRQWAATIRDGGGGPLYAPTS